MTDWKVRTMNRINGGSRQKAKKAKYNHEIPVHTSTSLSIASAPAEQSTITVKGRRNSNLRNKITIQVLNSEVPYKHCKYFFYQSVSF